MLSAQNHLLPQEHGEGSDEFQPLRTRKMVVKASLNSNRAMPSGCKKLYWGNGKTPSVNRHNSSVIIGTVRGLLQPMYNRRCMTHTESRMNVPFCTKQVVSVTVV